MTQDKETLREADKVAALTDFQLRVVALPAHEKPMAVAFEAGWDAAIATMFEHLDAMPCTWELSWGETSDEDGAPCAWRIHRRSGNRSDREWTQLAIGETPTQAMLTAFQQENSDD